MDLASNAIRLVFASPCPVHHRISLQRSFSDYGVHVNVPLGSLWRPWSQDSPISKSETFLVRLSSFAQLLLNISVQEGHSGRPIPVAILISWLLKSALACSDFPNTLLHSQSQASATALSASSESYVDPLCTFLNINILHVSSHLGLCCLEDQ